MGLKKTARGWQVTNESGKPQSKDDLSRLEAEERQKELDRERRLSDEQKKTSKWLAAQKKK